MEQTITELWRYPVKSLGGERLDSTVVEPDGVRGDHVWAVVDEATGRVASAKRTKLWSAMLGCRARLIDDTDLADPSTLEITFPDGTALRGDDPRTTAALSELVGRKVSLRSPGEVAHLMEMEWVAESREGMEQAVEYSSQRTDQDPGSDVPVGEVPTGGAHQRFYDLAPLHIVTTSSMNALAAGSGHRTTRRFRPEVVVGPPDWDSGWVEDEWPATTWITLGEVEASVQVPTMRCVMVNLAHQDLPAEPRTLRALAAAHRVATGFGTANQPTLGVYADVQVTGQLRLGDPVHVMPAHVRV